MDAYNDSHKKVSAKDFLEEYRDIGINTEELQDLEDELDDLDDELEELLKPVASRLSAYPDFSIESIRDDLRAARSRGYAVVLNRIVDRMGAFAVPVIGLDGRPFAALSIAALSDRLTAREDELVAAMQHEAKRIADPRVAASGTASGMGARK